MVVGDNGSLYQLLTILFYDLFITDTTGKLAASISTVDTAPPTS